MVIPWKKCTCRQFRAGSRPSPARPGSRHTGAHPAFPCHSGSPVARKVKAKPLPRGARPVRFSDPTAARIPPSSTGFRAGAAADRPPLVEAATSMSSPIARGAIQGRAFGAVVCGRCDETVRIGDAADTGAGWAAGQRVVGEEREGGVNWWETHAETGHELPAREAEAAMDSSPALGGEWSHEPRPSPA